jgi:hypothetical protein
MSRQNIESLLIVEHRKLVSRITGCFRNFSKLKSDEMKAAGFLPAMLKVNESLQELRLHCRAILKCLHALNRDRVAVRRERIYFEGRVGYIISHAAASKSLFLSFICGMVWQSSSSVRLIVESEPLPIGLTLMKEISLNEREEYMPVVRTGVDSVVAIQCVFFIICFQICVVFALRIR